MGPLLKCSFMNIQNSHHMCPANEGIRSDDLSKSWGSTSGCATLKFSFVLVIVRASHGHSSVGIRLAQLPHGCAQSLSGLFPFAKQGEKMQPVCVCVCDSVSQQVILWLPVMYLCLLCFSLIFTWLCSLSTF